MGKNNIVDSLAFDVLVKDNGFDEKLKKMEEVAKKFNISVSKALEIMGKVPPGDPFGGKPQKAIEGLKRQLADLEKQWSSLNSAQRKGSDGQGLLNQYRTLKGEAGQYGGTLNTTVKSLDKATAASDKLKASQNGISNSIRKANNDFTVQGRAVSNLNTLFTTYVSIFAVERLVSNIARVRGEFELQQVALRAIIQDAQAADTIFSQIKGLAIESPFQFKELTGYVKQLAAFSIETDKLFDTTSRLADVSAGLGVDMGRIILAYGQVRSASVLRGQELRQFTEAGIPLVDKLAKKFGELEGRVVSAGEVFEKISNRQVSFGMVDDIFSDLTSEGGMFFEMQAKQAETLAGKLSNLKDAYEIMLNEIGMANDGVLKGGIDGLRSLMENWRGVGTALMTVVAVYGAYKVASALNTQMLGKENQELIKRLLANKEMIASELRKKAVYSTLSEEEIALTRNTNTLTNADLRNLAANGLLTKSAALRMIATKQLTAAHGAELVSLNLITQAELTQALATTKLGRAKLMLAGVVGKVSSALKALWVTMLSNPLTWIVVAVQGVISLFSTMSEHANAINEINNKFDELSKRASSIYGAFSKASGENLFDDQKKQLRALLDLAKEDYRLELDIDFTKLTPQNIIEEFNRLRNELLNAEVFLRTFSKEWQEATEWTMQDDINEDLQQLGGSSMAFFDLLKGNVNNTIGVLEEYKGKLNEVQLLALESLKTPQKKDETQLQYLERLSKAYKTTYGEIVELEAGYSASIRAGAADKQRYIKEVKAIRSVLGEFAVNDKFNTFFSNFNKDLVEGRTEFDNFIKTIEVGVNQLPEKDRMVYLKAAIEKQASENNWNEFVRDYVTKWTNEKFNLKISFIPEMPNANLADWQKSLNEKLNNLGYKEAVVKIHLETSQGGFSEARAKVISTYQKEKQEIDELNKAKKQGLAYDDGALSTMRTKLEIQRKKAHLMGISDEELDGKGEKGKDPVAEKLKNQIDLLKKAEGQFEKYLKIASKGDAIKNILGDAQFKSLGVDFKDYSPADTRKYLDQIYNSIKGNPRFKAIQEEIEKIFTDLDYDSAKKTVDDFLSAIKTELDKAKSDYDLVQNLLSKGVDKSSVELLLDVKINNKDKGDMIRESISKLLNESVGDIGSLGDIEIEAGVTFKDAFDSGDIKKVTDNLNKVPEAYKSGVSDMLNELQTFDTEQIVTWANIVTKYGEAEAKKNQIHQEALQERTAIEKKYAELIAKAKDGTQKEQLTKERDTYVEAVSNKETQGVAKVDFDAFKETDEWKKSFEDLDRISTNSLNTIIGKLENFAQSTGSNLNVTEFKELIGALKKMRNETEKRNPFQTLAVAITEYKTAVGEVKAADDEVATSQANLALATQARINAEAELSSGSGDKVAQEIKHAAAIDSERKALIAATDAAKKKDNAEDKLKNSAAKANKSFKDIASYASAATSGLTEIFTSLGVDMDGVFGAIWGGFSKIVDGLASIDLNNPVSIITGSAKAISGVLDMIFGSKQAVIENQIKDSVKQVKRLENAYSDLERAVDKALGDDKFKEQSKLVDNLNKQMSEVSKQADLERSKKNSDGDKVDDLERQYVELQQQIEDLLDSIKEDILGSAKDIAQELGDALFEAFANGTDAAEAWGAKVDEIIGGIIKKMIISTLLEKPIGALVDNFAASFIDKDGNVDREKMMEGMKDFTADMKGLYDTAGMAAKDLWEATSKELGLAEKPEAGEGLKESIKGVTEDTASLLASYMNAIRQHVATHGITLSNTDKNIAMIRMAVANLNMLVGNSQAMSTQAILHLKNIEANTFNTAAEAKAIAESAVKTIKVAVEIAESNREIASYWKDVTTGTKKINVK